MCSIFVKINVSTMFPEVSGFARLRRLLDQPGGTMTRGR
jgi:hypothetical protein